MIDTNVISEIRKGDKANQRVRQFFDTVIRESQPLYLSEITVGEPRRDIDLICHRGDDSQGQLLENWLNLILAQYQNNIFTIDNETALIWGKVRVPNSQYPIDKLIAATTLIYNFTAWHVIPMISKIQGFVC